MSNWNKTTSNYSILSNREKFDDKQKKLIDKVKLDLFESLDIDNKLVNRNNFSDKVKTLRNQQWNNNLPNWEIEIKTWIKVKINPDSKTVHKDIFDEYKRLQKIDPVDENELTKLDRKLSERLILDKWLAVEFKSWDTFEWWKSAEDWSKSSFQELNNLTRYQDKIEWASKNINNLDYFLIKWKPKELEKIRGAEQVIKAIEETKTSEKEEIEGNKNLADENKRLKKEVEELKRKLNELNWSKENNKEAWKESVEKINTIVWDLENKDINYKKGQKLKVESNLRVWWTLILNKWSSQIAVLEKKDDNWFICKTTTDSELKKLIDKDHYVLDYEWNKSYISYIKNEDLWKFINFEDTVKPDPIIPDPIVPDPIVPDPVVPPVDPDPIEAKGLELDAVISDMWTDVHRERVSLETEEELRDRYKWLAWYNVPYRAYLFLSRWAKRKIMIKKKMKDLSGKAFAWDQWLDEKTGDASDRHELELQHNLSEVQKANSVTLQNPLVNNLCKDYLNWIVNDTGFQKQFNTIVDNDSNIQSILKWQKITHIGTNILLKLKQQKAKMDLMNKVDAELNQYFSNKNQIHINNINKEIENYIKLYQTNPDFMKDYEDLINNVPGAKNKLQLYFQHQKATMKMQVENIKMNMNVLVKWKSAYQIDNKDRQKWRMYKLWNKLDKLPRWVQTAGFVWVSVWTWLLTWWLWTFAAAAITTWVTASSVWFLNAIKKRTHHTKEQNTHEKNVVTDYRNEQARIAERQNQALNGKWYKRKTYKAKRQLALYDQTTQENIQIANTISDSITDLSSKIGTLDAKEENYMKKNLIEWRARFKYYRETGHNFLASNEKEQIEKDMKRLEKSLILWSGKLWKNLNDIETMQARDDLWWNITYDSIQKDLKNSYDKSLIQFKRERRNLAIKYGVWTAVMSAGMSIGMQYLMWTWVFAKGEPWTPGTTFTEWAKENFELWKHNLLDTWTQNNIYNTWTDVLKDPRLVAGSEINIAFWAGTDATAVIPWNLTAADYSTKLAEVISNIKSMWLSSDMEKQFIDVINAKPWEAGWSANFTNDALHGMRSAEFIEQTARAFADSGRTDLVVKFAYDSSLDIAWTNVHNVSERVVNATYNISTPDIPWTPWSSRWRFLVAPLFFNTFKDRVKWKENTQKDNLPKDEPVKPKKGLDNPTNPTWPKVNPPITDKPGYWKKKWKENWGNPFKDDDFEPIKPRPFDKDGKIWVTPRATFLDNIDIDPKNLWKEYPSDFRFKTDDEIVDIIIDQKVPLYKDERFWELYNDTLKIEKALNNWDRNTAKNILKESLKKEREFIKQEESLYIKSIDTAFNVIDKTFNEIWWDRSQLPDKSKVHIVGNYEFRWQKWKYNEGVLGFCSYMNWELFINRDALHYSSSSDEEKQRKLTHTIIHEIIHWTSTANYRHQYKDETKLWREDSNNRYPNARRLWAMLRRFSKNSDWSIKIQERWRALNEGITEQLTIDILNKELKFDAPSNCYPKEREVLAMICKAYNIDIKDFYKLLVNRKVSLKNINEKLSTKIVWNNEVKTPSFYSLLMSIMDYEYDQEYNKKQSNSYKLTKALINWETLMVTPEMRKFFHPGLLENWEIKKDILDDYKNILDVWWYRAAA